MCTYMGAYKRASNRNGNVCKRSVRIILQCLSNTHVTILSLIFRLGKLTVSRWVCGPTHLSVST
jgi:hypothetical protein